MALRLARFRRSLAGLAIVPNFAVARFRVDPLMDYPALAPVALARRPAQGGTAGAVKQSESGLRERVRCASRVDWPFYPRLSPLNSAVSADAVLRAA
jgi:hypothetical protein